MSSLLSLTKNLYQVFRQERPATDAAVLQLREFLTNHFGHEGTRAYQQVDETTSTRQVENVSSGAKSLKRFVHPITAAASVNRRPIVVQSTPIPVQTPTTDPTDPTTENDLNAGAGVRQEDGTVVPLDVSPVGDGGADDLGKPLILPENQPSTFPYSPGVPVAGNFDLIDLFEISEMKPKAGAGKYPRQRLIETLKHYGVNFQETGSNTQLAAALIQYATAKTAK